MKSNNLWDAAKSALDATIEAQKVVPGSNFYIIPFGDAPYETFSFDSENYKKNKPAINNAFDEYISQAKYTRISDVLGAGIKMTDPNKENKIYLLTDGMPNGGDSPEKVANVIQNWCTNHRNCRLFYVALTQGVVNSAISRAIDSCPDAFMVQCDGKLIPQIADISSEIFTNLEDIDAPKTISFSIPGKHGLVIESTDPYFNVEIPDGCTTDDGSILIFIKPKSLEINALHQIFRGKGHDIIAKLQCTDRNYFIANPTLTIHVADKIQSKLTFCNAKEELYAEGVVWYNSFLFSEQADDENVTWNLAPKFTNGLPNSSLTLRLNSTKESEDDYEAWFNGQPIKDGGILTIKPDRPAILEVCFNNNAQTGKRYFTLTPTAINGLDIINDRPSNQYESTSLRTYYDIGWNPLKTFLFWLLCTIMGLLLLWILILRQIIYPSIKMSKITILGPGTYYISPRIRS